jgi:hypothetical protein
MNRTRAEKRYFKLLTRYTMSKTIENRTRLLHKMMCMLQYEKSRAELRDEYKRSIGM